MSERRREVVLALRNKMAYLGQEKTPSEASHILSLAEQLYGSKDKPLSKRDAEMSMRTYMDKGYSPEAILNCCARLGWGPTVDDKSTSLLPTDRMLDLFLTGGKMRSQTANFDQHKLDSFDRKYKARKPI